MKPPTWDGKFYSRSDDCQLNGQAMKEQKRPIMTNNSYIHPVGINHIWFPLIHIDSFLSVYFVVQDSQQYTRWLFFKNKWLAIIFAWTIIQIYRWRPWCMNKKHMKRLTLWPEALQCFLTKFHTGSWQVTNHSSGFFQSTSDSSYLSLYCH